MSTFIDQNELLIFFKKSLKDELYGKSLLRTRFQVRPIYDGELPIFKHCNSHVIDDNGKNVMYVSKGKIVLTPMFEISSFVKVPKNAFNIEKNKLLDSLIKKVKILKEEDKLYEKIRRFKGKGIIVIRIDLTVLPAHDVIHDLNTGSGLGFSIFEHIGVGKILSKSGG